MQIKAEPQVLLCPPSLTILQPSCVAPACTVCPGGPLGNKSYSSESLGCFCWGDSSDNRKMHKALPAMTMAHWQKCLGGLTTNNTGSSECLWCSQLRARPSVGLGPREHRLWGTRTQGTQTLRDKEVFQRWGIDIFAWSLNLVITAH